MPTIALPTLHADQVKAFHTNTDPRGPEWGLGRGRKRVALRCGRRWGKTKYGVTRVTSSAIHGKSLGWFSPDYKRLSEAYQEARIILKPITESASKIDGVIRTTTGGRIDFWTLNDPDAGRSRFYHGVVVDEGAFTNNGPAEDASSMLAIWERSIEPTLLDYDGWALVASNTNGVDPDNYLYAICNDPKWGFVSYHAPTISNPLIPIRREGESEADHMARRLEAIEAIRVTKHPLVFRQEYLAEFVDWSGVAFFDIDKWLVNGEPVEFPTNCDGVFAIIDSAVKTGSANDATAVLYCARNRFAGHKLILLGYGLVQIEGALLETWLPVVLENLEAYAKRCGARNGSLGAFIEDKSSGEILLQQARRRSLLATPIDSRLTALGKDERAINASGYHFRGEIKISRECYDLVFPFKGTSRNHLVSQVTSFRIGDKAAAKRADDLLDCYTYAVSLALGDGEGF